MSNRIYSNDWFEYDRGERDGRDGYKDPFDYDNWDYDKNDYTLGYDDGEKERQRDEERRREYEEEQLQEERRERERQERREYERQQEQSYYEDNLNEELTW